MNNPGNSSQGVNSKVLGFAQSQGRGVKTAGNGIRDQQINKHNRMIIMIKDVKKEGIPKDRIAGVAEVSQTSKSFG